MHPKPYVDPLAIAIHWHIHEAHVSDGSFAGAHASPIHRDLPHAGIER